MQQPPCTNAHARRAGQLALPHAHRSRARGPGDKGRYLSLSSHLPASLADVSDLVPLPPSAPATVELPVHTAALDRLPGASDADPFLRLAAAFPPPPPRPPPVPPPRGRLPRPLPGQPRPRLPHRPTRLGHLVRLPRGASAGRPAPPRRCLGSSPDDAPSAGH